MQVVPGNAQAMPLLEETVMIIKKQVEVNGQMISYEIVIRNELEASGDAQQFDLITHDPDLAGGRREGFLCHPDKVPMNHVVIGKFAFK